MSIKYFCSGAEMDFGSDCSVEITTPSENTTPTLDRELYWYELNGEEPIICTICEKLHGDYLDYIEE